MKRAMAWTGWLVAGALLVTTTPVVAQAGDLITGKDVKDGSLTGKDVRRGAIESSDVANGTLKRKDLGERVRPPKTQIYELYHFETGPQGGPTGSVAAYAKDVAPHTLVESIDIRLYLWEGSNCHNGEGHLKLGDDVIAHYLLESDQATMSLGSGDTGSQRQTLRFRFSCSDADYTTLAGGSVFVTYQLTRRDLDHVIKYPEN